VRVVLRDAKGRRAADLRDRGHAYRQTGRHRIHLSKPGLVDHDPLCARRRVDPAEGDDGSTAAIAADVETCVGHATVAETPPRRPAPGTVDRSRSRIPIAPFDLGWSREERDVAPIDADPLDDRSSRDQRPGRARSQEAAHLGFRPDAHLRHDECSTLTLEDSRDGRSSGAVDQMPRSRRVAGQRDSRDGSGNEDAEGHTACPSEERRRVSSHPHARRRTPLYFDCER